MSVIGVEKDLDTLSLILVADFDAPIERVWQLWADPRQLERWWGPPTHPATVEKHDLAIGGEVSYFMTGPGGEKSRGWWRVTSVNPPTSLEFTDGFANQDGTPNAQTPTTAVRMRLAEHDGGTRMELRFIFESREHMERLERWGAFEVYPQSVGQMDALLAGGAADLRRTSPVSVPAGVEDVRVVVGGEHTDGHLGLIEETLSPDFDGPPLHVHPAFDELFFVLDGELVFQVRDGLKTVAAGDWLLAPRGVPHTFANHSDQPARALIAVTPAGFERYFRLVSAQLTGTEPPADAFGPRPATEPVGPPIPRKHRG